MYDVKKMKPIKLTKYGETLLEYPPPSQQTQKTKSYPSVLESTISVMAG